MRQRIIAVLLTSLIAGCGSAQMLPQQRALPAIERLPEDARARISLRIPRSQPDRAHYVSPNSSTMKIRANGKQIASFKLSSKSKYCSSPAGATQCTFSFGVPSGKVNLGVSLYSARNALLSQATIVKTFAKGQSTLVPLVLAGVVKTIDVTLQNPNPNAGVAANVPVYLTAYDASGAAIVGPGNYSAPLTMVDTDKTGATSIAPATVKAPETSITLKYTGKSLFSATIGATAKGATVDPAQFVPTPYIFASFSTVGLAPAAMVAITTGPDKNVWVTVSNGGGPGTNAIVRFTQTGTPTAFDHANTPELTDDSGYEGIVEDAAGNVWFTESNGAKIGEIPAGTAPGGTVKEYDVSGLGTICPEKIVNGNNGDLWFTSSCSNLIGNITTTGTPTGPAFAEGGGDTEGLMLSKIDGKLYAVDRANQSIDQYPITGHSAGAPNVAAVPDFTNKGTAWPNASLGGIAQTSDGQLWFSNSTCAPNTIGTMSSSPFSASTIREYSAPTGSSIPNSLAVAPDGKTIFVALGHYPEIERIASNGPVIAPVMKLFAVATSTPNDVFQGTTGIVVGPNGNLWMAVGSYGYTSGPNVLEMAY